MTITTLTETYPLVGFAKIARNMRLKCTTCAQRQTSAGGQINHLSTCTTNEQPSSTEIAVEHDDETLKAFATNVRKYGQTKGEDALVEECVRKGFLSMSDAMNSDD